MDMEMSEADTARAITSVPVKWNTINRHAMAMVTNSIVEELHLPTPHDTIELCGSSLLSILETRPIDVLHCAKEKLYTWRFDEVPIHWRRLYEEACLCLALRELEAMVSSLSRKDEMLSVSEIEQSCENSLAEAIQHFDNALFVAGAPGREALIHQTLAHIEDAIFVLDENVSSWPAVVVEQPAFETQGQDIPRHHEPITLDAFQKHLDSCGGPTIISAALEHWPALSQWRDLSYLLRRTLDGRRIVPVEIGTSYTDDSWRQTTMQFSEFVNRFMLNEHTNTIGYLAQHDLFKQIPRLRNDVAIPDYCYATTSAPSGAAAQTFGLATTPELDEPAVNAWLGPRGTRTPLHTDAYHNILCQVIGYKYVRLYSPEETTNLYPMGVDEKGIDMGNTSAVNVRHIASSVNSCEAKGFATDQFNDKYPLFRNAQYQEAMLGPGECLYIPLGWWHYVESLTNSFSVSFWFN